jgi:hypothetical protein
MIMILNGSKRSNTISLKVFADGSQGGRGITCTLLPRLDVYYLISSLGPNDYFIMDDLRVKEVQKIKIGRV